MINLKQLPFQREDNHLILSHPEFLTEPQKEVLTDQISNISWEEKQAMSPTVSQQILATLYHTTEIPLPNDTDRTVNKIIDTFSLTDDWNLANFLLPEGKLINGSISRRIRDIDHREVRDILEQTDQKDYTQIKALTAFLNTGTLRISQNDDEVLYLETQTTITEPQQETLIRHLRKQNLTLQADISSPSGILLSSHTCMWSIEIQDFFQTCNQFFDLFEILK